MPVDLATCEWNPGANRSLVDPIAAVARLAMPAPMRVVLVEKIRRHQFDDTVRIDRDSIRSESGAHAYDAAITNMNFGRGHLCRTVTRTKWAAGRQEGAIVYLVEGRAFGYAAACGNLFELVRRKPPVVATPPAIDPPSDPQSSAPPVVITFAPPAAVPEPTWTTRAGGPLLPSLLIGAPVWATSSMPPVITASPVPEPETWLMMLVGVAALVLWNGVRRGR